MNKFKIIVRRLSRLTRHASRISVAATTLAIGSSALGQVSSINLTQLTNAPLPLAASTGVISNNVLYLTRDCDLAAAFQFFTTNGPATVTVAGSFSIDTTNFGLSPFTLSGVAVSNAPVGSTSTTNTVAINLGTNFNHSVIAGYTAVNFYAWTNSSSTSAVFNAGSKLNRPTINTQTF